MTGMLFVAVGIYVYFNAVGVDRKLPVGPSSDTAINQAPESQVEDDYERERKKAARKRHAPLDTYDSADASPYSERRRARFRRLLAAANPKVLLTPCVRSRDQNYSFDRIERSLVGLQIADQLNSRLAVSVSDPFLTMGALGEGRRMLPLDEAAKLAQDVGAAIYITCEIGYTDSFAFVDNSGDARSFSIILTRHGRLSEHAGRPDVEKSSREKLPFSNTLLPHVITADLIGGLLAEIGFAAKLPGDDIGDSIAGGDHGNAEVGATIDDEIPVNLRSLISDDPQTDEQRISRLAFVANLFPLNPEIGGERLSVKLLHNAYRLPKDATIRPIAIARALYRLGRRPAALAAIESVDTDAAVALKAVLNGDLPALESATAAIDSGIAKVLAEFDLSDVRNQYGSYSETDREEVEDRLEILSGDLYDLLQQRLRSNDPWRAMTRSEIKSQIDATFPREGFSRDDIVKGKAVLGEAAFARFEFELATIKHVRRTLDNSTEYWCCNSHTDRVDEWDLLNLFESMAEAEIFKDVALSAIQHGSPARALDGLVKLESEFAGHPEFARLRATALTKEAQKMSGSERDELLKMAVQSLRNSVLWSAGQTISSAEALELHVRGMPQAFEPNHVRDTLVTDFPMKQYWPLWSHGGNPHAMFLSAEKRLSNATSNCDALFYYAHHLKQRESVQAAVAYLDSASNRFNGCNTKLDLRLDFVLESGDTDTSLELLSEAINSKSDNWKVYERYAKHQVGEGNFDDARDAAAKYPAFADYENHSAVTLSNYAYKVGSFFFWRGITNHAREFYEMAARFGSGSEANIGSKQRNAIMDKNYPEAVQHALRRANRYNSAYAFRDYMSLLFLLGYSDPAWSAFNTLAPRMGRAQIWAAADVGHRIVGTSYDDFKGWLSSEELIHTKNGLYPAPVIALIRFVTMDREVPTEFDKLIENLVGDHQTRVTQNQKFTIRPRPGSTFPSSDPIIGPSFYQGHNERLQTHEASTYVGYDPEPSPGEERTLIPSEYVLFARAFAAMKASNFESATEAFEEMATYYEFAHPNTIWSLPYVAESLARSGKTEDLSVYLDQFELKDRNFDWHLAMAWLAIFENDTESSLTHLEAALNSRPHDE
ncbi:MAG: hypothetical protein AAF387_18245, partial [Pseudomonadota bacterium]